MSNPIKFAAECESFNRRIAEVERTLAALVQERENLLITCRDSGIMVSAAKAMLGKVHFNIVMPEDYVPPAPTAEQQAGGEIIRHDEKAA